MLVDAHILSLGYLWFQLLPKTPQTVCFRLLHPHPLAVFIFIRALDDL